LPLPPIRPRDLGVGVAPAGSPVAADLPLPPIRPRAVAAEAIAEAKPVEVAALAAPPVATNLPLPPRRNGSLPETVTAAVAPPALPAIMSRPVEPEPPVARAYAPANLPVPPSRVAALSERPRAMQSAQPVVPIRVKNAVDAEGRADLTALIEAESARHARPRAVVNVTAPPVEKEIRSGVVALPLGKAAPVAETGGFAGRFIRPIAPRFTKAGE
jgi:hypothetical protein